jgi:hypothetical protein
MHADTVRKALKELVNAGLLIAQYRRGMTTIYRVDHQRIINGPPRKEGSTPYEKQGDPPSTNKGVHPFGNKGGDPYEKQGDKVYPTKSIPLSNNNNRDKKMNDNVLIIELSKAIKALEESCEEFKGQHRGEVAGGEYIWTDGTKPHYLEMRKELKAMKERHKRLLMEHP